MIPFGIQKDSVLPSAKIIVKFNNDYVSGMQYTRSAQRILPVIKVRTLKQNTYRLSENWLTTLIQKIRHSNRSSCE